MNKLLKILSSVMFACVVSTGAMSEIKAGLSLATAGYYGEGTEVNGGNDATTQGDGAFLHDHMELFVEYDLGPVAFGLSYTPNEIDTPENTNKQTARNNKVYATFTDKTTAYIMAQHEGTGLYAKLGATYVDIESKESTGSNYPDTDTVGVTVGLGWQLNTADDVFWRIELQGTAYDDVTVNNGKPKATGGNSVTFSDMMGAQATLSIGRSF